MIYRAVGHLLCHYLLLLISRLCTECFISYEHNQEDALPVLVNISCDNVASDYIIDRFNNETS